MRNDWVKDYSRYASEVRRSWSLILRTFPYDNLIIRLNNIIGCFRKKWVVSPWLLLLHFLWLWGRKGGLPSKGYTFFYFKFFIYLFFVVPWRQKKKMRKKRWKMILKCPYSKWLWVYPSLLGICLVALLQTIESDEDDGMEGKEKRRSGESKRGLRKVKKKVNEVLYLIVFKIIHDLFQRYGGFNTSDSDDSSDL